MPNAVMVGPHPTTTDTEPPQVDLATSQLLRAIIQVAGGLKQTLRAILHHSGVGEFSIHTPFPYTSDTLTEVDLQITVTATDEGGEDDDPERTVFTTTITCLDQPEVIPRLQGSLLRLYGPGVQMGTTADSLWFKEEENAAVAETGFAPTP